MPEREREREVGVGDGGLLLKVMHSLTNLQVPPRWPSG